MRIADSDRERAMADLAMHYTDGRLDHEEYDERLDAIWTARTRADLALLFSDLPRLPVSRPPVQASAHGGRVRACGCRCCPVLALLIALSIIVGAPAVAADLPAHVPPRPAPWRLRAHARARPTTDGRTARTAGRPSASPSAHTDAPRF